MKRLNYVLLVLILSSCSQVIDMYNYSKIQKEDIYYPDDIDYTDNSFYSTTLNKRVELREHMYRNYALYCQEHIKYKQDDKDSWDKVTAVLDRGYGDCEDFSKVFLDIYYVTTGIKGDLILCNTRDVINGGRYNHAIINILDNYIDPQIGNFCYGDISYFYSFNDLFNIPY